MGTKKMSLANMQGKLCRSEMKNIVAGVADVDGGGICEGGCHGTGDWVYSTSGGVPLSTCRLDIQTYCSSGAGYCQAC